MKHYLVTGKVQRLIELGSLEAKKSEGFGVINSVTCITHTQISPKVVEDLEYIGDNI